MSQAMWPQHGHILCTHNTHLFGDTGACSRHENFLKLYTLRSLLKPFWPQIPIFQSYLYTCFMSTWKQLHMLRTDSSFPHYFYPGTSEFYMGTGPGMPGCSYTTATLDLKNHETMPAMSSLMTRPLSEKSRRGLVTRPYSVPKKFNQ